MRGSTCEQVAQVVQVGQAVGRAAQAAKVCGQPLRGFHRIRRIAARAAALAKVECLLAKSGAHCVLEQELHGQEDKLSDVYTDLA